MRTPNNTSKRAVTIVALLLAFSPILIAGVQSLQITASSEYNQFVHIAPDSVNGGVTVLDKPIFPVMINNGQIPVGRNWTITCPLEAGHKYQIYCYGAWTNNQTAAKTDYDIYVYDPSDSLISTHTEAAGVIEHLNSADDPNLFTPSQTGTYTFLVKNDARESQGAQQATFMIIENIEANQWYTSPIQGKADDGTAHLRTTWAYEFTTNASQVEVYLTVPATLDMYEARLFLMNDGSGPTVNSYPLAIESGLYGNVTGKTVGGYNFETDGSRGVAYASCEHMGDDMFLNYTGPAVGTKLYYLVLIGEEGQGDVNFMVKTNFESSALTPVNKIERVYTNMATELSYQTTGITLTDANLTYSADGWETAESIPMAVSNQTCNATIPGQKAGTTVDYRINATDILENSLSVTGNFTVKTQPKLNITLSKNTVLIGQNITVTGVLKSGGNGSVVDIEFMSAADTQTVSCDVADDGTFTGSFGPQTAGTWSVLANAQETDTSWTCSSSQYMVTVKEPPVYVKYSLYIVIGLVAALAASVVVYYLRFRGH